MANQGDLNTQVQAAKTKLDKVAGVLASIAKRIKNIHKF